ncbi:hypothetical protein [Mesorhizobium sp.]|uniref:hypothetical protein n=1 Tax=Mesorhizobium sp. TaxID=1871066 RepID=UPI00120C7F19|nr:hypothetical protein [Mesorhizobium sp.]TIS67993.1 MAG: hypothetical protein E5W92_06330 [Mesorhizobium sp.]
MVDRFANLMKLKMGRNPSVDVTTSISSLIDACKFYYEKDDAIAYIAGSTVKAGAGVDETNAIYIADLEQTDHTFNLLLVRGDPSKGVPGFVNTKTRKVTTIESDEPGVVRAVSCHLVFSTQEIAAGGDQGRYRMVMEQATGIGRALARDFIGKLLARYAEDHPEKFLAEKKRTKKGEKPEQIQYRPTVRFNPQENANLKDDLKNGKVGGFKLVRGKTDFKGEADEPLIQKMDVELHAKIVPTANFGKVRSLVDHLRQQLERIDFEDLRLELIDEGGHPITGAGAINLDELEDEADMRYCKKMSISGLKETPKECYDEFYEPIIKFAVKALSNENHWK